MTHQSLEDAARSALIKVPGIDAVFLCGTGEERQIFVLVQEHENARWADLIEIEDKLSDQFGYVEIKVRAHQGRGDTAYRHLVRIL